jgi:hypothetical protein
MTFAEKLALWVAGLTGAGIVGLVAYEHFRTPPIAPAAPGAVVPTTSDGSGGLVVQLVAGQALGTLTVATSASQGISVNGPSGQSPTSYTSSNQAVMPSGTIADPLGGGVSIGAARAAGTATLTFYGGGWGSSFVLVAT